MNSLHLDVKRMGKDDGYMTLMGELKKARDAEVFLKFNDLGCRAGKKFNSCP